MRFLPILTAFVVAGALFGIVMQRDKLLEFAGVSTAEAAAPATVTTEDDVELPEGTVRVLARRSVAETVDSAVILRGQTEALRQVDVRAETSGKVVSDPLRRGAFVEEGQLLCEIDPGTRNVSLQEAMARLAEAKSRLPEAEARRAEAEAQIPAARARIAEATAAIPAAQATLREAEAGIPAAEARLAEARTRIPEAEARLAEALARVPEAEARLAEAEARVPESKARLAEAQARVPEAQARLEEAMGRIPEAQARLREAEAGVPAARARLLEAEAQVPAAEAALREAEARVPEADARLREAQARQAEAEINLKAAAQLARDGFAAQTRLATAEAAFESAKAQEQAVRTQMISATAGIEAAKGRLEGARAGVETARAQIETALAAVSAAQSQIQNAEAGIIAARAQVESATAGVQAAESQIQNALAGIQAAKSQVQTARAGVQSAESQIEGASATVQTAESQIEGARAAAESARSRVEGARATLISAEAQLEGALAGVESAKAGEQNARAGIQSAEAAVAAAEKEIERLQIHAPFAGLLETDTAELGALLQPGGNCATVIQLDPIRIVGFVPETDIARVQLGARAAARLVDDREVFGTVSFVSRSADPVTRTFRVELTVDNADLALRDGQTAEIAIEAEGAEAHLLPQTALTLDDDGRIGVRTVATDSSALFMPVSILRDTRDGIWVAGLPTQADVIVVGQEYVIDGVPVAPTFEEVLQ